MTGELYLDAPQATAAGRDLSAAGSQLAGLSAGPVAEVAAMSQNQPWGRDEIGAAFQKDYGPLLQKFVESFGKVAGYVEDLGEAAVQSVVDNTAADSRASSNAANSYRA
ncbi:hypothetical protein Ait01nite_074520 [Actinoplanes italicus]|uniref:Excreted virulence factor EspC (Type VII ESX diderm) n=1 Tax=Actinoplanes italicus TaxID=113567 RepID=A0A2T0K0R7_9ACTN|nr:hypothetical protein [Actinoplanes italicus]PRX16330.1 hypothetical protein CLV67_120145 [Actinoplanes italicus]GIE34407.1 hypothetical protein Ait01nite_074520 [Actinoplanes italicus]